MKVVIDGNIGSGKTTQLNIFESKGFKVNKEPITQWPLDVFYSDPSRWALMFQLRVLQTLPTIISTNTTRIQFYERCQWSAIDVFWQYMLEQNQVTYWEDQVLKTAFEATKCEPSLYIYIKKSPEDCFAAIQTRRQAGDSSIELSYLEALDALYERMLEKIQCKKVVIDATGKTPAEIHSEIITVLKSSNELHSFDA